ncbi:MAG: MFS transporter [Acetobacteraceae bacterium]|nr:MFS transporter [Acetobacteraceae bacterium]
MTPLQRRLSLTLGVTQLLAWGTTYYVPATMIDAVAADLGASRTVLLGAFSWAVLIAGFCAPAIGGFIDRHGGRPVLAAGQLVTAAGLLVLAAAPSVPWWYAAWTVLGVGMALALYDTAFSTVGRLLGAEARPAMTGITLIAGFGGTLGFPMGTWLAAHWGWRPAVVLYAGIAVLIILPMILFLIPRAGPVPPPAPRRADEAAAPTPQRRRFLFLLLATFVTLRASIGAVVTIHLLLLLTGVGLTTAEAVLCAMVIGPSQVASRMVEWRLARFLTPMKSAWVGAVMLPVGVLLLLGGAPAVVFAVCYGISNGILTITRGVLPMHVFGPQGYATLMGRMALPSQVSQALAPTLVAPLLLLVSAQAALGAMGLIAALAMLCLVPVGRRG